MRYSNDELLRMYEQMVQSRVYEETIIDYLKMGKINSGAWHMAIGEEAAQTGCIDALSPDDFYMPSHRTHGVLSNKLDINKFTAECLCKAEGYNGGKSSIVHVVSIKDHILPVNGILGAGMPLAVGYAMSLKRLNKPGVVVASIGDGASNEGNFYESINLAGVLEAPIVFFIENNSIAFSTPIAYATRAKDLSAKATAVGLPGITVDGNDILAVREAMEEAIEKARHGQPSVVEAKTTRLRAHAEGLSQEVRSKEVMDELWKKDPLSRYEKVLKNLGILDDEKIASIREEKRKLSEGAFAYANACREATWEEICDLRLVYKDLGGDLA